MTYRATPFPDDIAYGASGGPNYQTEIVTTVAGREKRLAVYPLGRCRYDVSHGVKDPDGRDRLIAFFRIAQGRAHSFPFRDFTDHETTHTTGLLGTGNGTGLPVYQMGKRYVVGADSVTRTIRKPQTGEVIVKRNSSDVAFGASAGQIAIDYQTGIVTFVADATSGATSITAGATTTVVLTTNPGTLIAGQRLHLSGFAGANAALVNGIAHTINSVSGSGPFTFVLATNTNGATITLGSGAGARYPQVADSLTWAGKFYVPCRFDQDQMAINNENYQLYSWGQVTITETLDD